MELEDENRHIKGIQFVLNSSLPNLIVTIVTHNLRKNKYTHSVDVMIRLHRHQVNDMKLHD